MATAAGTFDVRIEPVEHDQPGIGRMSIAKTWHGELAGTGVGTMLSAGDPAAGEAGYVALETFEGTLAGRLGSFAFQQLGVMHAGGQDVHYAVVPGSGTDELTGMTGTVHLEIADGEHRYRLTYSLS